MINERCVYKGGIPYRVHTVSEWIKAASIITKEDSSWHDSTHRPMMRELKRTGAGDDVSSGRVCLIWTLNSFHVSLFILQLFYTEKTSRLPSSPLTRLLFHIQQEETGDGEKIFLSLWCQNLQSNTHTDTSQTHFTDFPSHGPKNQISFIDKNIYIFIYAWPKKTKLKN